MNSTSDLHEDVVAAVKALAAGRQKPTLAVLTVSDGAITARPTPTRRGSTTDGFAEALVRLSRAVAQEHVFLSPDVVGYAAILPGECIAFAADHRGGTHHIALAGAHGERPRTNRWNAIVDTVTALARTGIS